MKRETNVIFVQMTGMMKRSPSILKIPYNTKSINFHHKRGISLSLDSTHLILNIDLIVVFYPFSDFLDLFFVFFRFCRLRKQSKNCVDHGLSNFGGDRRDLRLYRDVNINLYKII